MRSGAPGPHAHGNAARQAMDDRRAAEVHGQQKPSNDPRNNQHSPSTPTTGLREHGNDTSRSTGRSGRQNAATRRNMRKEERVTVQGPIKKQQPDGMPHGGGGGRSGASSMLVPMRTALHCCLCAQPPVGFGPVCAEVWLRLLLQLAGASVRCTGWAVGKAVHPHAISGRYISCRGM